jgi:hypothetical protein
LTGTGFCAISALEKMPIARVNVSFILGFIREFLMMVFGIANSLEHGVKHKCLILRIIIFVPATDGVHYSIAFQ